MTPQQASFAAGCFAAALGVTSARAQEVADAPELHVGDEWIFHVTGTEDGNPVDRKSRRKIVESLPDGRFLIQAPAGAVNVFDSSWNPRLPELPDFWPLDFKFPLKVGDSWTFASPAGAFDRSGRIYDLHGGHHVAAFEQMTIPAGTFGCFKIVGESSYVGGIDAGNPDYHHVELWKMTRWYCPEIRFLAKTHIERYTGEIVQKGRHDFLDSELVSFSPALAQHSLGDLLDGGAKKLSKEAVQSALGSAHVSGQSPLGAQLEYDLKADGYFSGNLRTWDGGNSEVVGTWSVDDSGKICSTTTVPRTGNTSKRCGFLYALPDQYYFCESDSDRAAPIFKRVITK
jgi:hypothetical protein